MKKILIAVFIAAVSLSANAQVWVSGQLGFNTARTSVDGTTLSKGRNFTIAPEVGYKLNDKLDIAMKIGYAHAKNSTLFNYNLGIDQDFTANGFQIAPYVRYTFAKAGNFSFFADGGFGYALIHVNGYDKSVHAWEIAIEPGVSYALSDKFGLVAHVGNIGWQYAKYDKLKSNAVGVNANLSTISFGAYVNL